MESWKLREGGALGSGVDGNISNGRTADFPSRDNCINRFSID